jgi:hypothetical protein
MIRPTVVFCGLKLPITKGVSDWIEIGRSRETLFVEIEDWRVPAASMP